MIEPDPAAALRGLLQSHLLARAIYVVAQLGVAEQLALGPRSCAELALRVEASDVGLARVLQAVAGIGIVSPLPDGRYALGPVGRPLLPDAPDSMRAVVVAFGEEAVQASTGLLDAVRTGSVPFERVFGTSLRTRAASVSSWRACTRTLATHAGQVLADTWDFSGVSRIAAQGDDDGEALLAPVLAAWPELCGASGRVGPGAEIYLVGEGLAWDDDHLRSVLREIREVIATTGRVLVIQRLVPRGTEPGSARVDDLIRLTLSGASERTEAAMAALVAEAGFDLACVVPTRSGLHLLEAVPV